MDDEKTIFFVRHAESEENVKFRNLCEAVRNLTSLRLPTIHQITSSVDLLRCDLDSSVSRLGHRQITDIASKISDEKFLVKFEPEIIFCSPLVRARVTCLGLFGDKSLDIRYTEYLREACPHEYIFPGSLDRRIRQLKQLIAECPKKRIVLVGHNHFFRRMLETKTRLQNVDMWKACFLFPSSSLVSDRGRSVFNSASCKWKDLELLYRSRLSYAHPFDEIRANNRADNTTNNEHFHGNNDRTFTDDDEYTSEHEPCCRICHMTRSEQPSMTLIRPCRCSGSLEFVHLRCLNEWRSTSQLAQIQCAVCSYHYQITRSRLAELISSDKGPFIVSFFLIILAIFVVGGVMQATCSLFSYDCTSAFYRMSGTVPWWKHCHASTRTSPSFSTDKYPFTLLAMPLDLNGLGRVGRHIFEFLEKPSIRPFIFCNQYTDVFTDVTTLGLLFVGFCGFAAHAGQTFRRGLNEPGGFDRNHILIIMSMVMQAGWIATLFTHNNLSIVMLFGLLVSCTRTYEFVSVLARKIGHSFGETITEVQSAPR